MIEEKDIAKAQQTWKEYVLSLSAVKDDRDALQKKVDAFYQAAYQTDNFAFKPTRTAVIPFRNNWEGFVSYFIGGDPNYSEDAGFALQIQDVRFENDKVIIKDTLAVAMGHYFFTVQGGDEMKVEYTFVYEQSPDGLKIVAHHSSMPFSA